MSIRNKNKNIKINAILFLWFFFLSFSEIFFSVSVVHFVAKIFNLELTKNNNFCDIHKIQQNYFCCVSVLFLNIIINWVLSFDGFFVVAAVAVAGVMYLETNKLLARIETATGQWRFVTPRWKNHRHHSYLWYTPTIPSIPCCCCERAKVNFNVHFYLNRFYIV